MTNSIRELYTWVRVKESVGRELVRGNMMYSVMGKELTNEK